MWEALALGFRPPTEETVERLVARDGARALADAAAVVDDGLAAHALALAVEPAPSLTSLRLAHGRLFGHTARARRRRT
jgi:hypothetical protein